MNGRDSPRLETTSSRTGADSRMTIAFVASRSQRAEPCSSGACFTAWYVFAGINTPPVGIRNSLPPSKNSYSEGLSIVTEVALEQTRAIYADKAVCII